MKGFGTIANALAVVLGSLIGLIFKKQITKKYQETIYKTIGLGIIFVGLSGAIEKMVIIKDGAIATKGNLMSIVSLMIGCLIGEMIDIDKRLISLGFFLKEKFSKQSDNNFIDGFIISTITICVGAMAIIGPLNDILFNDRKILYTKSFLDFVILVIYGSNFGIGSLFSFIPLIIFQGFISATSFFLAMFLTQTMLNNISTVGSMIVFALGCNMFFDTKIKVANLIPALIICIILGYFNLF